jgi:copper chaperone NosL
MKVAPFLALMLLSAACASTTPVPVRSGDVCFHCRRTITEPKLATEMFDTTNHVYKFSSVACLTEYLRDHPTEQPKALFATDYSQGRMLSVEKAYYVKFLVDPQLKIEDYAAFRSQGDATEFASANKSAVIDWAAVSNDKELHHTH